MATACRTLPHSAGSLYLDSYPSRSGGGKGPARSPATVLRLSFHTPHCTLPCPGTQTFRSVSKPFLTSPAQRCSRPLPSRASNRHLRLILVVHQTAPNLWADDFAGQFSRAFCSACSQQPCNPAPVSSHLPTPTDSTDCIAIRLLVREVLCEFLFLLRRNPRNNGCSGSGPIDQGWLPTLHMNHSPISPPPTNAATAKSRANHPFRGNSASSQVMVL